MGDLRMAFVRESMHCQLDGGSGCVHGKALAQAGKSHYSDLGRVAPGPHKEVGSRKAGRR